MSSAAFLLDADDVNWRVCAVAARLQDPGPCCATRLELYQHDQRPFEHVVEQLPQPDCSI